MADREQARERSDATARALKGSLNSALEKGLVFSYMLRAGLEVMGKQKVIGGCSPCLLPCTLLPCPPCPTFQVNVGWMQRGERLAARSPGWHLSPPTG